MKITNTLDDQQGGSVNYAAGLGVSLPSGHIGLSDRDNDGISEVLLVAEGELGIGVAGGFTSETAGGIYDDYIAPTVKPIKDGLGSLSDTIWSYLPEI